MYDITVRDSFFNFIDPDERDKFRQTCLQNEVEFRCY